MVGAASRAECREYIIRDNNDLSKFVQFLTIHNPFDQNSEFRNISTGVVADERVDVATAIEIGRKLQNKITGQTIGKLVFKKSDKVSTFATMRKAVKVGDKEIHLSSTKLYHRLLSISYSVGLPQPVMFSYELAATSPALFTDDGNKRKSKKAQLAKYIAQLDERVLVKHEVAANAKVYDGWALLHCIPWPKIGTLLSVCNNFMSL